MLRTRAYEPLRSVVTRVGTLFNVLAEIVLAVETFVGVVRTVGPSVAKLFYLDAGVGHSTDPVRMLTYGRFVKRRKGYVLTNLLVRFDALLVGIAHQVNVKPALATHLLLRLDGWTYRGTVGACVALLLFTITERVQAVQLGVAHLRSVDAPVRTAVELARSALHVALRFVRVIAERETLP